MDAVATMFIVLVGVLLVLAAVACAAEALDRGDHPPLPGERDWWDGGRE